ncbi:hypothetical protein MLD38_030811 [Melastoma candidum]|uniref:Uncharacterized protein n=1 Tax=Melastoma candidum TaxID=119954 RepID=A0ACB9MM85_9MYRT|nr:hypothetical protein MLD38_030811 [Melastoma candidum]
MASTTSPKRSPCAKGHVRSISLPSRSHPASLRVVDELNRLRSGSSATSSGSARGGLASLEELYEAVNEFLAVPLTQQAISYNRGGACVDGLLDGSVWLLDAFGVTRDVVSAIREHARGVRSAIRRRNPCLGTVEEAVSGFLRMKRKLRKDVKGAAAGLKRIEEGFGDALAPAEHDQDFRLVMTVLREAVLLSVTALRSLLSSLDNGKKSKWGVIMVRLVNKGEIASREVGNGNDFEALDDVISGLSKDVLSMEKVKMTQEQLRDLEIRIGGVEDELDGLYRRMIRTRVSLLNILSQ